jgi:ribosomal protein S4
MNKEALQKDLTQYSQQLAKAQQELMTLNETVFQLKGIVAYLNNAISRVGEEKADDKEL